MNDRTVFAFLDCSIRCPQCRRPLCADPAGQALYCDNAECWRRGVRYEPPRIALREAGWLGEAWPSKRDGWAAK